MPGPSAPGAHEPLAVGPVYGTVGRTSRIWHIIRQADGNGPAWCGKAPESWFGRLYFAPLFSGICPRCRREYERELR